MKVQMDVKLTQLYRGVPAVPCKGLCTDSCGPVAGSSREVERLQHASGRRLTFDAALTCSMLDDGRCVAYQQRPMICRIWGATKEIACPHGCVPERWLTRAEARDLLDQARAIGGPEVVAAPAPAPVAKEAGHGV